MTWHKSRNLQLESSENISLHSQTTSVRKETFALQPSLLLPPHTLQRATSSNLLQTDRKTMTTLDGKDGGFFP